MCSVRVIFLGAIRAIAGRRDDQVSLPADKASIAGLVEALSEKYGERLARILTHESGSSPLVVFFVNGESIGLNQKDENALILRDKNEIEVSLISQMSGGKT